MTRPAETMSDEQIAAELAQLRRDDWKVSRHARGNMAVRRAELEREQQHREGRFTREHPLGTYEDAVRDELAEEYPEQRPPSPPLGAVLAESPDARVRGHLAVTASRMQALERAIRTHDWQQVEWEYDRVLSSIGKLSALLGGER